MNYSYVKFALKTNHFLEYPYKGILCAAVWYPYDILPALYLEAKKVYWTCENILEFCTNQQIADVLKLCDTIQAVFCQNTL